MPRPEPHGAGVAPPAPRPATTRDPLALPARLAGAGYLLIIVTGIYAEFAVRGRLVVAGDAAATAANVVAAEALYRTALASELVMLLADVGVAVALYVVFRTVSRDLALLAAAFRLVHAAVVGANLLNAHAPLLLLGDGGAALPAVERQALASVALQAHAYGYAVGLVFFGAYCLVLGWLVLRSRLVPRVLGALLLLAAAGYLLDAFARTLLVDYARVEATFAVLVFGPAFVAELAFALWLLLRGIAREGAARSSAART